MSRGVSQMDTTKETIIEAFLTVLSEKDFEKLSVTEIIQKAGYSRSTFYLYYADKYDLLDETRKIINNKLLSFYSSESKWAKNVTYHLCFHILNYRSFYKMEFSDATAILHLSNQLASHLFDVFNDWDYAIFASYGTIGYLHKWLKDGFIISPNEASEKLLKIGLTNWRAELEDIQF